jgi:hypothetical protein
MKFLYVFYRGAESPCLLANSIGKSKPVAPWLKRVMSTYSYFVRGYVLGKPGCTVLRIARTADNFWSKPFRVSGLENVGIDYYSHGRPFRRTIRRHTRDVDVTCVISVQDRTYVRVRDCVHVPPIEFLDPDAQFSR